MSQPATGNPPWWRETTGYQWLVFSVAAGAWLFDNLDQRIFSLARIPAIRDLMGPGASLLEVQSAAKQATALFLIGWGLGGLTIGALGDRFGRVRLLTISILTYSVGTGLTALAVSHWQFVALRLLTGIGIGGVFGLAAAIIAETASGRARLALLALLQVLSTVGNLTAALIKLGIDRLASEGHIAVGSSWRWLFAIGFLPALIAVASAFWLREPETWQKLKREGKLPRGWLGAYRQLLADRTGRRNLTVGTLLAVSGVVGLWAVGEYAVDLQDAVFTAHFASQVSPEDVVTRVAEAKNWAYLLQMTGAAFGMFAFTIIADRFGRRPAFTIGFSAAFLATMLVYWRLETPYDAIWMMPLMGAAQFSVFAGFSIYLPELFPATTRGTGVSFAYNLGRFAAAGGSLISSMLSTRVFGNYPSPLPLRYSAMVMCCVFLLGIVASRLAPETRGKVLSDQN